MENEPIIEPTSASVAESYIDTALAAGRENLKKTRIIAASVTVCLVGYLSFVTATFHANLEPEGAATVATGLASERFDELEPTLATFIHEQVPQAIRRAPDEIIARMPEMRENLEKRVEEDLRAHSADSSKRLSAALDKFIEEHKDEITTFAKNAQDPDNAEKLGDALEKDFTEFLHNEDVGGSTIAEKLDNTLEALEQVDTRTARLAMNKKLSPSEHKARHAVALLMHRINSAQDDGSVEAIHGTVNGIATAFHP